MQEAIKKIIQRRELVCILVERNLKIRYKNSVLGFLWSLLTPLAMILIYAVFAKILKFNNGQPDYLQFLVTGIVVWQFTSGCLNDSINAIVGNTNLVKKVSFPRIILPVSTALADAVNFLLTFIILVIYLAFTGTLSISANTLWIFAAAAMHLVLGIGLSCLCSVSNVFFRDTQHIVGLGSMAWFFLSPVFYGTELQTGVLSGINFLPQGIIYLNPMTGILSAYRAGLMGLSAFPAGMNPSWMLLSAGVCAVVFLLGMFAVRSGDKYFGDIL